MLLSKLAGSSRVARCDCSHNNARVRARGKDESLWGDTRGAQCANAQGVVVFRCNRRVLELR